MAGEGHQAERSDQHHLEPNGEVEKIAREKGPGDAGKEEEEASRAATVLAPAGSVASSGCAMPVCSMASLAACV